MTSNKHLIIVFNKENVLPNVSDGFSFGIKCKYYCLQPVILDHRAYLKVTL